MELLDLAAARCMAIKTAGEMLQGLDGFWGGTEWQMHVTDGETTLLKLNFSASEVG